jgi:hypothetical protein
MEKCLEFLNPEHLNELPYELFVVCELAGLFPVRQTGRKTSRSLCLVSIQVSDGTPVSRSLLEEG